MVPQVHRCWRTSFRADASMSSAGAVIDGAKDLRWPLTRRLRPVPSRTRHRQEEHGKDVARGRLSQRATS